MSTLHSTNPINRRLSLSESREIAAYAARGESVTAIAARFGVSRPTVYRAITKHASPDKKGPSQGQEQRVSTRLDRSELAALDVIAGRFSVSRSELARRVLRRAAEFLEPDEETTAAVRELVREMKSIGGNLNQIAQHLNREARMQGRASPTRRQLEDVERFERDIKQLGRNLEGVFLQKVKVRRARLSDLLKGLAA